MFEISCRTTSSNSRWSDQSKCSHASAGLHFHRSPCYLCTFHSLIIYCCILVLSGWETADGERPAGIAVRQHEVQSCRHPGQVSRLLAPLPPEILLIDQAIGRRIAPREHAGLVRVVYASRDQLRWRNIHFSYVNWKDDERLKLDFLFSSCCSAFPALSRPTLAISRSCEPACIQIQARLCAASALSLMYWCRVTPSHPPPISTHTHTLLLSAINPWRTVATRRSLKWTLSSIYSSVSECVCATQTMSRSFLSFSIAVISSAKPLFTDIKPAT